MSSHELDKFRYIEGGRNLPGGKFTRNEVMTLQDVLEYRKKNNNTGLYVTAYRYDSDNFAEATLYGDMYLDFDGDDFADVRTDALHAMMYFSYIWNIPEKFCQIYFSGKKGIHIVVPAEIIGAKPDKNLNHYYKYVAEEISERLERGTLDMKIYDRRRLFRLPNSKHHDTGYYKIPLTHEQLKSMPLEQIKEKAQMPIAVHSPEPYEIPKAKSAFQTCIDKWKRRYEKQFNRSKEAGNKVLDYTPPCIEELIDSGPQKGQRNNTAAVLISHWRQRGYSEQECWDGLVKWNNGSMTDNELKTVMQSVFTNSYTYGCNTLEILATCAKHECKLWKGKDY